MRIRPAALSAAVALPTAAVLLLAPAAHAAGRGSGGNGGNGGPVGNNGTVKIHDAVTGAEYDDRNQPKVCTFYLDAFGFDSGQNVIWWIEDDPSPKGEDVKDGLIQTNPAGHVITDTMQLPDGHYKLYWVIQGDNGNDPGSYKEAKHKVFKVDCSDQQSQTPAPSTSAPEGTTEPTETASDTAEPSTSAPEGTTEPTETASDTAEPSTSAPEGTTEPTETASETAAPSTSAPEGTAAPSQSTSTPVATAPVETPPAGTTPVPGAPDVTPTAAPSSSPSTAAGGLAETGSSGTGMLAAVAGVLALIGGAVLFLARRGKAARH